MITAICSRLGLPQVLRELITYGICGIGSLIIFYLGTSICQWINPEHVSTSLPPEERARNLVDYQIIAFFPANIWSWWSNRTFVFKGRKHSAWRELLMVFGIAAIAFILSAAVPIYLIRTCGIENSFANIILAFVSAIWNFILRRIFVFGSTKP